MSIYYDISKNECSKPMDENTKLKQLASGMYDLLKVFDTLLGCHDACETPRPLVFGENKSFKDVMIELGLEEER